jgi:hypothetical protein
MAGTSGMATAGTGGTTSTVTMPVAAGGSGGSMSMAGAAAPLAGMSGAMSGAGGSMAMAGAAGSAQAGMGGMSGSAAGIGGSAGMAGMMMMDAGSGAAGSGDDMTDCGTGGTVGKASNDGAGSGRGNGNVQFTVTSSNQILSLRTTLEVPVKPNGNSTLFIWPGLEPIQGSPHYSPIGTGVLQPVLTWGGSCAPGSTRGGTSWWISAQYVNTLGSQPGFTGCHGGDVMTVAFGDKLLIEMTLDGAVWNQTITDQATGKKVDFDFDLMMQEQRWALFQIEMPTSTKPASDVVFTDNVITLAKSEPKACQPTVRGANDYYSAPVSSSDGLRCCVSRLVLRAAGVAATTMDPAP